jgi:hypothetical protein
LYPLDIGEANELLTKWGHRLGPCLRPFHQESYAFFVNSEPISVAISASAVSATVAGYGRQQVVELARLCTAPEWSSLTRVMLRLWRELCGPRWAPWRPVAAISYHQNAHYKGNIYRFDGWECLRTDAGSDSLGGRMGAAWKRSTDDPARGSKTLWRWRYDREVLTP